MKPRTAALLLLSVASLFLVGAGLSVRLLRAGLRATSLATEQRLLAIGVTVSQALAKGAAPSLLDTVVRQSDLEAAYLLDAALRPVPSESTPHGSLVTLLRIDPDRALRALRGEAQVGAAYRLDEAEAGGSGGATILAGYFPVAAPAAGAAAQPQVLVLEAGAAFVALPTQLLATAWAAGGTAFGLAFLCALLVLAALRAAAREERLKAEAERGQTIRELAAMVAHELRNPLGTIRAGAELLREQAAPSTGSAELIGDILSEVARLSNLTTEFLQFSSDQPLNVGAVELGALCDELCLRLRREHPDETSLEIYREGDAEVPLYGDADRLRQVLANLAKNAVEAMQATQGKRALHLAAKRTRDGAEIRLRDTGPGINEKVRAALFVPFQTSKSNGTGLGLVICRRIIEKHGGTLALEESANATPASGACFVVRLPKTPPPAAAAQQR